MEELTQKFTCAGRSNCVLSGERLDKYVILPAIEKRINEIIELYGDIAKS
ncbi:MAG: hypothetical protein WD512_08615 [Candidatus Paceibacterota bacterium]